MIIKMRTVAVSSIAVALSIGTASAQQACSTYTVQQGDTLYKISRAAFNGDHNYHDDIYRLNRSAIGSNPNYLEAGLHLEIPCPSGASAPAQTAVVEETPAVQETTTAQVQEPVVEETPVEEPEPVVEETTTAATTETVAEPVVSETASVGTISTERAANRSVITFVTANGFPPYADEGLPNGGLIVELVETALARGSIEDEIVVSFVNDRESHMDLLLPTYAVDASFPWSMPDCGMDESIMTDFEIFACHNYLASDSFYTVVDGFYALNDSEYLKAFDFGDFVGTRICRPEGYSVSHLEIEGLVDPAIEMFTPVSAEDCFEMLIFGEVDLVAIDLNTGDFVISEMNITQEVSSNTSLVSLLPLNVVLMKTNPNAERIVEALNDGLAEMQQSGEWFEIGSRGLQYQMEAASMN